MPQPCPEPAAESRLPSVLVVCTGNVCRSPFAELLLRDHLPRLEVTSRGVFALEGRGVEAQIAAELATRGITPQGFRARQVDAADLEADLILTMSRRQRTHLLEEFPAAARKIGHFGHVPELVAASAENPSAPLQEVVATWTRRAVPPDRDIPDPYGKDAAQAARTAALLTDLVEQLVDLLEQLVPVLSRGADQP